MSQFSSRGFLYAPVKYTRHMWRNTAAIMMWAAQWWSPRTTKPNGTLFMITIIESYAGFVRCPVDVRDTRPSGT